MDVIKGATRGRSHARMKTWQKPEIESWKMTPCKRTWPYFVLDSMNFTMNELEQVPNGSVQGHSTASFALRMVECFIEITIQMFILLRKVAV